MSIFMAGTAGHVPPFFTLPRELRDQIYLFYYQSLQRKVDIHVHLFSPARPYDAKKPRLKACFALTHASRQLRHETLPGLLASHKIIIHPGPASSLNHFMLHFNSWLPYIRNLRITDADVFLDCSAQRGPNGLQHLLASVSRQSGASLRQLSISLPRSDWNNLAGWKSAELLKFWLFREILALRGLDSFEMCRPPERIDRPRWGRKPSWDVVAKRMVDQKWKAVEDAIAEVVTGPVDELSV